MRETNPGTDCFSASWEQARDRFREAVRGHGGILACHDYPDAQAPSGEPLTIDVGLFGSPDADNALLVVSGTHGLEGFTGSAAQLALMRSGSLEPVPGDVRVVLVHGLNAFGFAHLSRTNENNVDLNRNFLDFAQSLPVNDGYAQLHPLLCPDEWSDESRDRTRRAMDAWIERNGLQAFMEAAMKGQWHEPTGLLYGGTAPERSHLVLDAILAEHLHRTRRVGFIDWHAGLGAYGAPFFLCFNEFRDPLWERCCQWWGRERIEGAGGFDGAKRPRYEGLVFRGVQRRLRDAQLAGAVIEFGTVPVGASIDALRADRWLRFGATADDAARARPIRSAIVEAFCPSDPGWRSAVVGHALDIQRSVLAGVAAWR